VKRAIDTKIKGWELNEFTVEQNKKSRLGGSTSREAGRRGEEKKVRGGEEESIRSL